MDTIRQVHQYRYSATKSDQNPQDQCYDTVALGNEDERDEEHVFQGQSKLIPQNKTLR